MAKEYKLKSVKEWEEKLVSATVMQQLQRVIMSAYAQQNITAVCCCHRGRVSNYFSKLKATCHVVFDFDSH